MSRARIEGRLGEDTKARIYRAAVEMFYDKGYTGASLRSIIHRARVQMSSVYYYYSSKQELLFDVMKRTVSESTEYVLASLEGKTGAAVRLEAALQAHIEWHTSRQKEAFIADAELGRLEGEYRREIVALRDRHESIFRTIIEDGIASGEMQATDASLVTRFLMSGATGVAGWYRPDGKYTPQTIGSVFASVLREGLRSR